MPARKTFYSELAYVAGIVILALGTVFMERADFGVSMVVAPAYLIYLKLSALLPWFTFGMAEYTLQAVLLIAMCVVLRRFRVGYLFSFVTAVFYGVVLDLLMLLGAFLPKDVLALRFVYYTVGVLLCSVAVAFLFRTYVAPEVYELFVKELSAKYGWNIHKVKTVYDCISCLVGVILSFVFFGLWHFEGVKWGTILCALVNGFLIGRIGTALDRVFDFRDRWKLRERFFR